MRKQFALLALVAVLLGVFVAAPVSAQRPSTGSLTTPVTGTVASLPGGAFNGTLNITQFAVQNGQLVAIGTLTGTITQTVNNVTTTVGQVTNAAVTLPVTDATGSCPILHLVLGPLDLNLLGLTVHLNQVVLDITAQSGPGNLLGNLLCAVAHLLDNPSGQLSGLVNQLNHILSLL